MESGDRQQNGYKKNRRMGAFFLKLLPYRRKSSRSCSPKNELCGWKRKHVQTFFWVRAAKSFSV
jgi:hypothetical protein